MRPTDDEQVAMADALRWQREYVDRAGSPVAGLVLGAVIADLDAGGRLAGILAPSVRFGDLPGLRVMAAVHLLALQRQAPAVALRLPTLGGTAPSSAAEIAAFQHAVVALLVDHADVLTRSMRHTPQTNETGRAALLRAALSRVDGRPVRLRELGASAGLNLRADHLPGDPALEQGPMPPVVDRVGCDLSPVDPTTTDGRALLSSYIWVDDIARFARLGRALTVAQEVPAVVRQMDAAEFVQSLELEPGTTTVVWHSAMWLYLPEPTRRSIREALAALGQTASSDMRLVHASWEWDVERDPESGFALVTRTWDGVDTGRPRLIARGRSHGADLVIVPDEPVLEVDPLTVR